MPDNPGQPDPGQPGDPGDQNANQNANLCQWCAKDHSTGFFRKIVGWFHGIFVKIFSAKYNPDGTPYKK